MKPLKTFKFEHLLFNNTQITLKAYDTENALYQLELIVKDRTIYKLL